jgi:hypothetical protein
MKGFRVPHSARSLQEDLVSLPPAAPAELYREIWKIRWAELYTAPYILVSDIGLLALALLHLHSIISLE